MIFHSHVEHQPNSLIFHLYMYFICYNNKTNKNRNITEINVRLRFESHTIAAILMKVQFLLFSVSIVEKELLGPIVQKTMSI